MFFISIGFIFLFIILFFISRLLIKNLYLFLYLTVKNKAWAIKILTFIFLPGTIIHEVSHLLVAEILGVKTGEFNFIPEIIEKNKIKVGSLQISKSDDFRQTIIGLGPIFVGLAIIFYLASLSTSNFIFLIIIYYLLFIISNTMFSSKKDLETIFFPLFLIIFLIIFFGLANFSFSIKIPVLLINFFLTLNLGLKRAILINLFLLALTKLLNFVIIKTNG